MLKGYVQSCFFGDSEDEFMNTDSSIDSDVVLDNFISNDFSCKFENVSLEISSNSVISCSA
jgi:hypothetical protein